MGQQGFGGMGQQFGGFGGGFGGDQSGAGGGDNTNMMNALGGGQGGFPMMNAGLMGGMMGGGMMGGTLGIKLPNSFSCASFVVVLHLPMLLLFLLYLMDFFLPLNLYCATVNSRNGRNARAIRHGRNAYGRHGRFRRNAWNGNGSRRSR